MKRKIIPLCWKCSKAITFPKEPGVTEFTGCAEVLRIKDYEDAKQLCPVIKEIARKEKLQRNFTILFYVLIIIGTPLFLIPISYLLFFVGFTFLLAACAVAVYLNSFPD